MPVEADLRVESIDVLRGAAVLGMLALNIQLFVLPKPIEVANIIRRLSSRRCASRALSSIFAFNAVESSTTSNVQRLAILAAKCTVGDLVSWYRYKVE
jgi:uncharacterized membrane protein